MIPTALSLTGTTSNVNVGSSASLDDIPQGTVMAWVRPTASLAGARVFQKAYSGAHGSFTYFTIAEGGVMTFTIDYTTTDLAVRGGTVSTAGRWQFVAAQWDTAGAGSAQKLFYGGLVTPAAEPTYTAQVAGVGARNSDAAASLIIGNRENNSVQLNGAMALLVISNATLTLDEIRRVQYQSDMPRGCVGYWRLGAYGTGRVLDESGQQNHGTPTAAVPVSEMLPRVRRGNMTD